MDIVMQTVYICKLWNDLQYDPIVNTVKLKIIADSQIDSCLFYTFGVTAGLGK